MYYLSLYFFEICIFFLQSFVIFNHTLKLQVTEQTDSTDLYYKLTYLVCIFLIFNTLYVSSFHTFFIQEYSLINQSLILVKQVLFVLVMAILIFSRRYLKKVISYNVDFLILLLLSVMGLFCLISSNDIIIIFLAIELQGLSFYVLAASNRFSKLSTEAGLKYFILGSFASGILIFGLTSLYAYTGCIHFDDLHYILMSKDTNFQDIVSISIIFITIGFLFKLGAFPFHMWLPDVYEGSPTPVTAFFVIIPKLVLLIVFFKISNYLFFEYNNILKPFVYLSIAGSIMIGSLGAIFQSKLKRLLAYGAIAHTGFLLFVFFKTNDLGLSYLILYNLSYAIASLVIFGIILTINVNNREIVYLSDLKGLKQMNLIIALAMSLSLLSIGGIPPLLGFFSKYVVLSFAISNGIYSLAFLGILGSLIAIGYYLKITKIIFFDTNIGIFHINALNYTESSILIILLSLLVLGFVYLNEYIICIFYLLNLF